jgi:hypothetical protein
MTTHLTGVLVSDTCFGPACAAVLGRFLIEPFLSFFRFFGGNPVRKLPRGTPGEKRLAQCHHPLSRSLY